MGGGGGVIAQPLWELHGGRGGAGGGGGGNCTATVGTAQSELRQAQRGQHADSRQERNRIKPAAPRADTPSPSSRMTFARLSHLFSTCWRLMAF